MGFTIFTFLSSLNCLTHFVLIVINLFSIFKVVEYSLYDKRIGKSHLGVPGHDGDFGFGGHCFPKDLAALIEITKQKGNVNNVLSAAQATNNAVRSNRDWEKMKGRAIV